MAALLRHMQLKQARGSHLPTGRGRVGGIVSGSYLVTRQRCW